MPLGTCDGYLHGVRGSLGSASDNESHCICFLCSSKSDKASRKPKQGKVGESLGTRKGEDGGGAECTSQARLSFQKENEDKVAGE